MEKVSNDNHLNSLQQCELNILKNFVSFCKKNNLTYYISGGTYLGAVRHKGFIPWDDDIDVAMPRTDYEYFLKHYSDEKYELNTFEDNSEIEHYTARIIDRSIKVLASSGKKSQEWSAWIDVFPLDGMPNNKIINKIHQFRLMYLRARFKLTCIDQVNLKEKNRPIIERIIIKIGFSTNLFRKKGSQYWLKRIDKALKKYPEKSSKYYINFMGSYKLKSMLEKDFYYQEGAYYEFENMQLFGPKNYDAYLTHIYGDYMKIPDKEDQNKHNTKIIGDDLNA